MPKPRTRKAMIEFLQGHFRYDTMSSWNQSTSYANKIKVSAVVERQDQDAVYAMLDVEDAHEESQRFSKGRQ